MTTAKRYMMIWQVSLLLSVIIATSSAENHAAFGQKLDYNQTTLQYQEDMMQDRNMATDQILRHQQFNMDEDYYQQQLEQMNIADRCPHGSTGLQCQRQYALKGADECADGGMCVMCRKCHLLTPISWPVCCKNHFHCCRTISRACQRCDIPELYSFCRQTFGRCYYQK